LQFLATDCAWINRCAYSITTELERANALK
jgi:hypothetical protein